MSSENEHDQGFEKRMQLAVKDIQTFSKINRQAKFSKTLHDVFTNDLISNQEQLRSRLNNNQEFYSLVSKYWKRTNFESIRFNKATFSSQQKMASPLSSFEETFFLVFDLGVLHKEIKFENVNEMLAYAISQFKSAMRMQSKTYTDYESDNLIYKIEDDITTHNKKVRLRKLLISLEFFILANRYEILLELIKREIKHLKKDELEAGNKELIAFLKKITIAVDIHAFLKCRSWSGAADSIFQFIEAFQNLLSYTERIKLISIAFFLLSIGRFGQIYMPDYAIEHLDLSYDVGEFYQEEGGLIPEWDDNIDDEHLESKITSEERILTKISNNSLQIEKIEKENLYNEALFWINKILKEMNGDDRAAILKKQYLLIFNILMSAVINDSKKSKKTIDLISQGFTLIAESAFDESFQQNGLLDFNYSSSAGGQGLNDLRKEFIAIEDEYKHQFFAGSRLGGCFLIHVDFSKCQTAEAQKSINAQMNLSYYQEQRKLANHLNLSILIKRQYGRKKHLFVQKKNAKSFKYEDRLFTKEINIYQLLMIDQLPGQEVIQLMKQFKSKLIQLRQMIVSKYATNSLDIHFILAKAQELEKYYQTFYDFIVDHLNKKGQILQEFEDLDESKEMDEHMKEARKKYLEFCREIALWMNQKAEPNLIEVERKSTRYKIKWENLNMFERHQKLLTAFRKKQEHLAKQ